MNRAVHHRRVLVVWRAITCALSLAILAGCANLPPAERESLIQAERDYRAGKTAQAIGRLDKIIRDYNQAVEISEAYYLRGLCRSRVGQEARAAEDLERACKKSKRRDLTARAKASLGAIAYRAGDWAEAAQLYQAAIPDLPDTPPTDQILFCAGVSLQRIGEWQEAKGQFGRILRRFRGRPVVADARRIAGWQHDYYAIQLGAYEHADKAAEAVRLFRTRRLEAVEENHPRRGRAMWVVMVGRHRTYAEAQAALPRVRRFQSDAFIIPRTH